MNPAMNPAMNMLAQITEQARRQKKTIVLPEGDDIRVLQAAARARETGLAEIVLLGDAEKIRETASRLNIEGGVQALKIIDPAECSADPELAQALVELRRPKEPLDAAGAEQRLRSPLCFANMLVRTGRADGVVAGAAHTTREVLSTALKTLGVYPGINTVSGAFIMQLPESAPDDLAQKVFLFADCAVVPAPDPAQLSDIAVSTADTAEFLLGLEPRVAMLSFSTHRTADHELADRVREATRIAKDKRPGLLIDGELQVDAAIVADIAELKAPTGPLRGTANVLIFPDLQSGNIAYKLVQRLAGARATGPILQGMGAPLNDLSRGCSPEDVLDMIAVTAVQAQRIKLNNTDH